jgi:hypothetical protein
MVRTLDAPVSGELSSVCTAKGLTAVVGRLFGTVV